MANLEREWQEREKDNSKRRLTNGEKREWPVKGGQFSYTPEEHPGWHGETEPGGERWMQTFRTSLHQTRSSLSHAVWNGSSVPLITILIWHNTHETNLPQMHWVSSGISSPALLGYIISYASPVSCSLKQFPFPLWSPALPSKFHNRHRCVAWKENWAKLTSWPKVWGAGIAQWQNDRLVIERSRVRVLAEAAGEFSSSSSSFCADSYFGIGSTPVLLQQCINYHGHSASRFSPGKWS